MMKTMNIYMVAAFLLATMPLAMAQTNAPIRVACNDLVQKGDSLYIDAVITVKGDLIESRKSLTLTPVLETSAQREGWPSILLNGKNRQKVYQREVKLHNLQDEPHYTVLRAADAPEHTVNYKMAVGWASWMKDARLVLAQNLCGCGKEEPVSSLLIADKVRMRPTERYAVQPLLAYITPEAETEKHRVEVGTAFLDFQVGKYQILTDFRNNAAELAKIGKTIRTVTDDKNITPKGIVLKGFASPEGSYASNQRLADNRVKALRDYIASNNHFKADFFRLESEPEDWAGFKEKAEADVNIPVREEVLAIIGSTDEPDRKEAKLRALKGGIAYKYVLKELFPSLRRTEYRIDYSIRFFTVEEGREIIKTRPQQLSLNEMFAVANSYEVGSKEYNDVFEIAVRMYGDDPVANLNAANIALAGKNLEAARRYLLKAGDSPEAVHARGVMNLLEGNLDAARTLLEQADAAGMRAAAANLKELEKKQVDNALFDSFSIKY